MPQVTSLSVQLDEVIMNLGLDGYGLPPNQERMIDLYGVQYARVAAEGQTNASTFQVELSLDCYDPFSGGILATNILPRSDPFGTGLSVNLGDWAEIDPALTQGDCKLTVKYFGGVNVKVWCYWVELQITG